MNMYSEVKQEGDIWKVYNLALGILAGEHKDFISAQLHAENLHQHYSGMDEVSINQLKHYINNSNGNNLRNF